MKDERNSNEQHVKGNLSFGAQENTVTRPLVGLLASPVARGRVTADDVRAALGRLGAGHSQLLGRLPHALS